MPICCEPITGEAWKNARKAHLRFAHAPPISNYDAVNTIFIYAPTYKGNFDMRNVTRSYE
jgi:hypothetical protein